MSAALSSNIVTRFRKEIIIIEAIEKQQILSFNYHGLTRIVEPYIFGKLQSGELVLSAYQVDGKSRSSLESNRWRTFYITEIKALHLAGKTFESSRPDYNPQDKKFRFIIAQH